MIHKATPSNRHSDIVDRVNNDTNVECLTLITHIKEKTFNTLRICTFDLYEHHNSILNEEEANLRVNAANQNMDKESAAANILSKLSSEEHVDKNTLVKLIKSILQDNADAENKIDKKQLIQIIKNIIKNDINIEDFGTQIDTNTTNNKRKANEINKGDSTSSNNLYNQDQTQTIDEDFYNTEETENFDDLDDTLDDNTAKELDKV